MNASRGEVVWRIACVALVVVYLLTSPQSWQFESFDELDYVGLARSLAAGDGYTMEGVTHTLYPPAYPLLLSIIHRLDPRGWAWMYMLNALCGSLACVIAATWIRRSFGTPGKLAGWLALGSYYSWSFSTRYLISEPLFLLGSFFALGCAWRGLNGDSRWRYWPAGVAVGLLLSAMTRSGAVALTAALFLAGVLHALLNDKRSGFKLAVASAIAGGGFFLFWEVRAAVMNPDARESYFLWAARFLGLSTGEGTLVAANPGEGVTDATATWGGRCLHLVHEVGEYLASAARPGDNFGPLAMLLAFCVVTGACVHMSRHRSSPLALYLAVSLVVFSLTSWVTSYPRYLYVVGPLLYLFAVEGAAFLGDGRPGQRLLFLLTGLMGLTITWRTGADFVPGESLEERYQAAQFVVCAVLYCLCIVQSVRPLRMGPVVCALMITLPALNFAHSGMLLFHRWKSQQTGEALRAKNMTGLEQCAEWLRTQTPENARILSSFPRLATILADRMVMPAPMDTGASLAGFPGYVLLSGDLVGVPAFRQHDERALETMAKAAGFVAVFEAGDAAVLAPQAGAGAE